MEISQGQCPRTGIFLLLKWMSPSELKKWEKFPTWGNTNVGAILEVDLLYPESLHELHNDYPLAPENIKIGNVKKLVPHLGERKTVLISF